MRNKKKIFKVEITELGIGKYGVAGVAIVSRKVMIRLIGILIILLLTLLLVGGKLDPSWDGILLEYLKHLLTTV